MTARRATPDGGEGKCVEGQMNNRTMANRTPEWQAGIWNLDGPVASVDMAKQALAECGWWDNGQDPEVVDEETGLWMVWLPSDAVSRLEMGDALSVTTTYGQIDIEPA